MTAADLAKIARKPGYSIAGLVSRGTTVGLGTERALALGHQTVKVSKLEVRFEQQLAVDGMPPWVRNYLDFLPNRDLEIDFAWPKCKVGVEIQGGAHRASVKHLDRDAEKICLGYLAGWVILPFGPDMVKSGRGLGILIGVLQSKRAWLRT